jgi:hypothetical protein
MLSSFQFWRLVRACRVPARNCPPSFIDAVFAAKIERRRQLWAQLMPHALQPRPGLTFDDFVEVMARLAHARFRARQPLSQALSRLLKAHVLDADQAAAASDSGGFREAIATAQVEQVFERHHRWLSATFAAYCPRREAGESGQPLCMALPEFVAFATDARLVQRGLVAHKTIRDVFDRVQVEEAKEEAVDGEEPSAAAAAAAAAAASAAANGGGGGDVFGGESQMVFIEFLEAVAALACHAFKNPYQPLETKIDDFVTAVLQESPAIERRRHEFSLFARRRDPVTAAPSPAPAQPQPQPQPA